MSGQGQIRIETLVLGPVGTNCYLVKNSATQELLVIDPADQGDYLAQRIRQMEGTPRAVLLTHGHFDHIGAARQTADTFRIPIYALEQERELLADVYKNVSLPMGGRGIVLEADRWLRDQEELSLAGFTVRVLHTPGHTAGGACYYFPREQVLFSGDTLFCCSVGRTDLPTGGMGQLRDSLRRKLLVLPDETAVYPGHGESTTIRYEKRYNPYS